MLQSARPAGVLLVVHMLSSMYKSRIAGNARQGKKGPRSRGRGMTCIRARVMLSKQATIIYHQLLISLHTHTCIDHTSEMALVDYSDSESDGESAPAPASTPQAPPAAKPVFQKAAPGKIQVSLPSLKAEPTSNGDGAEGPPPKRARTGGAFSGFNALLPAPKRPAQNAPKAGISLKTSSEAAFSRNPNPLPQTEEKETYTAPELPGISTEDTERKDEPVPEPKLVGKATRFLPLSVSGKKKKKAIAKPAIVETTKPAMNDNVGKSIPNTSAAPKEPEVPKPKPKKSLFSVAQEEDSTPVDAQSGEYEPIIIEKSTEVAMQPEPSLNEQNSAPADPNSLEAVAMDMNLTSAQRRQLFGRQGKGANVTHFNLDAEYRKNEELRAAGEVIEHKAVKSIAPGKHSLQQLVNNARTQEDAMEDKWAEGRRARGEGSSKYGWSSGR